MALSKIWVFAEATDGKVTTITLEILTKARELADTVEVVTAAGADVAAEAGAHGATKVLPPVTADGKLLGVPVAAAIAAAIEAGNGPDAILLGHQLRRPRHRRPPVGQARRPGHHQRRGPRRA